MYELVAIFVAGLGWIMIFTAIVISKNIFRKKAKYLKYWKNRTEAMLNVSEVSNPIATAFVLGREFDDTKSFIEQTAIIECVSKLEDDYFYDRVAHEDT